MIVFHFISPYLRIIIKFNFYVNFSLMSVIIAFNKMNDVASVSIYLQTIFNVREYFLFYLYAHQDV